MKKYLNFYSIAGSLFSLYILLRIFTLGITYDEAWTLMDFVPLSVEHIVNCSPCDANNHLLNTLLVKLMHVIAPDTITWARLPNLLAGLFYVVFAAKISRAFLSKYLGYCAFFLLLANPFLLDFFSVARGYGLAIAFMLISVYQSLRFYRDTRFSTACWSLAWASLAVFANFGLVNFWFGVVLLLIVAALKKSSSGLGMLKKVIVANLVSAFVVLAVLYEPIRKLLKHDGLYFGGKMGFYEETVDSIIRYSLYNVESTMLSDWVGYILTAILTLAILLGALSLWRAKQGISGAAMAMLVLVAVPVLSNVMQHLIFGTLYLVARTALFYYPLFVLLLVLWLDEIRFEMLRPVFGTVALVLTISFSVNFFTKANFHKTITWEFDAHNHIILESLQTKAEKNDSEYALGGVRLYNETMEYLEKEYPRLCFVRDAKLENSVSVDYYLYYDRERIRIAYYPKSLEIHNYQKDTAMAFPDEGVYLFGDINVKE